MRGWAYTWVEYAVTNWWVICEAKRYRLGLNHAVHLVEWGGKGFHLMSYTNTSFKLTLHLELPIKSFGLQFDYEWNFRSAGTVFDEYSILIKEWINE